MGMGEYVDSKVTGESCKTCLYEGKYKNNIAQTTICMKCAENDYNHWQPKVKGVIPMSMMEDIKSKIVDSEVVAVFFSVEEMEYLLSRLAIAEKALTYYDELYKNLYQNIEEGELYVNWLNRQGQTARQALQQLRE